MLQRVKTAVLLVLVYSAVTYLGMRVMMVPSVSGLCLGALFALTFGLLFGRLGAFSAGIGAVIGCSFWRTSYDASAHSLFGRLFV